MKKQKKHYECPKITRKVKQYPYSLLGSSGEGGGDDDE